MRLCRHHRHRHAETHVHNTISSGGFPPTFPAVRSLMRSLPPRCLTRSWKDITQAQAHGDTCTQHFSHTFPLACPSASGP